MKTNPYRKLLSKIRKTRLRRQKEIKENYAKLFPNMHKNYLDNLFSNIENKDRPLLLDASVPYEPFEKEYLRTCTNPAEQIFLEFQMFARYQRKRQSDT